MDLLPTRSPSLLDPQLLPQLLWATGALIATLVLGALILAWLDRWRKRPDRDILTPADQLTAFRLSYEQGELSQEEYERIRAKLAPKIKQQFGAADQRTTEPQRTQRPEHREETESKGNN